MNYENVIDLEKKSNRYICIYFIVNLKLESKYNQLQNFQNFSYCDFQHYEY